MNKPNKKYNVLFVDDEKRILNALRSIFRREYQVHIATGGEEALEILAKNDIDVIVSDQRMPNMLGNELLEKVHQLYPKTMRLLLTGFMDKEAIIKTINEGEIYRFINKPWNNQEIIKTVAEAALASNYYMALAEPNLSKTESISSEDSKKQHSSKKQQPRKKEKDGVLTDSAGVKVDQSIVMMGSNQELRNQVRSICRENDINIYGVTSAPQVVDMISARSAIGVAIIELPVNADEAIQTVSLLKSERPELISIILTDETDAETAVELINSGQVFRYLTKPLETAELKRVLGQAFFRHNILNTHENIKTRYKVEKPRGTISSHLRDLFSSFSRSSNHA